MGEYVNPLWLKILAWIVAGMIAILNAYLLVLTVTSWAG
jgi:manganese transport protein